MGILTYNYRSEALGYYTEVVIVYPSDNMTYISGNGNESRFEYKPGMKFQTVYLIHGGGDDASLIYRYTNAERYAQENNVMLVSPSIPNSFGVDACYGPKFQTYITEELPRLVQSLFASSPLREDNFIMGYAMGANVALGTALMRPDLYSVCVDMSGGIGMTLDTEALKEDLGAERFKHVLVMYPSAFAKPDEIDGSRYDIYTQAKMHKENGDELTKFYVLCGEKEFIRKRVEKDVELLKELGYDTEYICAEGYDHNFYNWEKYIKVALDEWLPLKRKPIMPEE